MSPAPNLPILEHLTPKIVARFWSRVLIAGPDECWLWQGRCTPAGYGVLSIEPPGSGKTLNFLTHRVAKTLALGCDLSAPMLRHTCHNRPCCNSAHSVEGTAFDNVWDSIQAGRMKMLGAGSYKHGVEHHKALYTLEQRQEALCLRYALGWTQAAIEQHLGCHRQSVARWCKEYGLKLLEKNDGALRFRDRELVRFRERASSGGCSGGTPPCVAVGSDARHDDP